MSQWGWTVSQCVQWNPEPKAAQLNPAIVHFSIYTCVWAPKVRFYFIIIQFTHWVLVKTDNIFIRFFSAFLWPRKVKELINTSIQQIIYFPHPSHTSRGSQKCAVLGASEATGPIVALNQPQRSPHAAKSWTKSTFCLKNALKALETPWDKVCNEEISNSSYENV